MYVEQIHVAVKQLLTFLWTIDKHDGQFEIVWDTVMNQTKAKERTEILPKECKCKTGCTS